MKKSKTSHKKSENPYTPCQKLFLKVSDEIQYLLKLYFELKKSEIRQKSEVSCRNG